MIDRNHPAVEAASKAWGESAPTTTSMWAGMSERRRDLVRARMVAALTAASPHLTADDLPTCLVRDIQARTLRAAARAATYDEGGIRWDHDWDRATVSAWLDGLADNLEGGTE